MAAECPLCGKPVDAKAKPFCSRRCADLDLGQWLKGGYAIPGAPADPASLSNSSEKDPDTD
jgi:endogenous inhibitor of DNA gyrase (YacG/DUF329 family)